jgi:hypothetical protein
MVQHKNTAHNGKEPGLPGTKEIKWRNFVDMVAEKLKAEWTNSGSSYEHKGKYFTVLSPY